MGWLHEGLLNDQAEKALDEMKEGEISAPVRVLEGYAILRLDEVREPVQHTLDHVRERATGLWQRDEGERQWQALIDSLRSKADINIIDSNLNDAVLITGIMSNRSVIAMAGNNRT
jgi:parvulin-like peptidyl-prolyl isomerase